MCTAGLVFLIVFKINLRQTNLFCSKLGHDICVQARLHQEIRFELLGKSILIGQLKQAYQRNRFMSCNILLYIYKALICRLSTWKTALAPMYHLGKACHRAGTLLVFPLQNSRRIGDGSFSVLGPTLWNTLPNTIRSSQTVSAFKRNLKTYLF